MSNKSPPATAALARSAATPRRDFQELWFRLSRQNWASVVLVPADAGGSAAIIARALADVSKWLRDGPVTLFVMSDPLDYASVAQITGLPAPPGSQVDGGLGRVIIAVQPVIVEPLGLAVTQAADAVILCIEMGQTHLAAARRTIELIGRERITGCLLVKA